MASEAICYESPTKFARYTIYNSQAIPLNTLLEASGAQTKISAGNSTQFNGIATFAKVAADGITTMSVALDGVYGLVAAGTIAAGSLVSLSGANLIKAALSGDTISGALVGKNVGAAVTATQTASVRIGSVI